MCLCSVCVCRVCLWNVCVCVCGLYVCGLCVFVGWCVGILVIWNCTLTEGFLNLTEGFPCYFLSCKANARVKLAKTGHGPHPSTLFVICVIRLFFVLFYVLFVCKCVLPPGDNPTAVNKYMSSQVKYMFSSKALREKFSHRGYFRQGNSRRYVILNACAACHVMHFCSDKTLVQFKRDGRHDVTIMQQTLAVREGFVFP